MPLIETVKNIRVNDDGKLKPILRLPFHEIPNAYLIVSFKSLQISEEHLNFYVKYQKPWFNQEPMLSFFYAGQNAGAEWLPPHGPIMIYTKCGPDWRGKTFHGTELKPKEHWFYDLVRDEAAAWSQMAVDEERLLHKLNNGDFAGIFQSLKRWANRDE